MATMRGLRGRVSLLLWTVAVLGWTVVSCSSGGSGSHQILWGRCYSYCLRQHLLVPEQTGEGEETAEPRRPVRVCQRHSACRWCLYVCERPEANFTSSSSCLRDCRFTRTRPGSRGRQACSDACTFVSRASRAKGGTCPTPGSLQGFQSACIPSCGSDSDCSKVEEKCCNNGCGTVCTPPGDVHILPPVPIDIQFKLLKTGAVMVKWQSGEGQDPGGYPAAGPLDHWLPVVYILRWWCPYTAGALTSVTDRMRTRLQGYPSGIYPGSKCHFMVAAVNLHGSRGFSKVSPYIKEFLVPSPPLHLDKVKSTVHDGKVDVTVQWQPPIYTDGLPVHRYQVFWSDSLPRASPNYMRLHMNRRTLSADRHSFVLHSLKLGTIYFVQVRAVVQWKGRQKVGKPASTYIETYSPPQQANQDRTTDGQAAGGREVSAIARVTVHQSFFHNTILKAAVTWILKPGKSARKYLIYWRAETCARNEHRKSHPRLEISATSHEPSFTLYNLRPECEYAVRVHPVSMRGGRTGAATVTNFQTPSCHLIEVRQGESPACHSAEVPEQVSGLHTETTECVTMIRWEAPSSPGPGAGRVESYDVMWGETEAGVFSTSTIIYSSAPHQLSVPANKTLAELGQLRGGQHYTVQVTSLSPDHTSSPPAILSFMAPHSDGPCRTDGGEKDPSGHQVNSTSVSDTTDDMDTDHTGGDKDTSASPDDSFPDNMDVDSSRDISIDIDVLIDADCCNGSGFRHVGNHSVETADSGASTRGDVDMDVFPPSAAKESPRDNTELDTEVLETHTFAFNTHDSAGAHTHHPPTTAGSVESDNAVVDRVNTGVVNDTHRDLSSPSSVNMDSKTGITADSDVTTRSDVTSDTEVTFDTDMDVNSEVDSDNGGEKASSGVAMQTSVETMAALLLLSAWTCAYQLVPRT